jgi:hypothetical protein
LTAAAGPRYLPLTAFSQNSVSRLDWIGQEVNDDPDWVSVKP